MSKAQPADRKVIVVAEDEPLVRLVACDILSSAGYQVVEGADADAAMVLLETRPDAAVLFTDVNMPGPFNGFALAHLAHGRWPELGIVVTTGGIDLPRLGSLPQGAGFLPKPYSPSRLLQMIAEAAGEFRLPVAPAT